MVDLEEPGGLSFRDIPGGDRAAIVRMIHLGERSAAGTLCLRFRRVEVHLHRFDDVRSALRWESLGKVRHVHVRGECRQLDARPCTCQEQGLQADLHDSNSSSRRSRSLMDLPLLRCASAAAARATLRRDPTSPLVPRRFFPGAGSPSAAWPHASRLARLPNAILRPPRADHPGPSSLSRIRKCCTSTRS